MSRDQQSPDRPRGQSREGHRKKLTTQQLARIRHELRTPVNHIIGYSDLLLEEDAEEFAVDLKKIRTGGKRLLELLNRYFQDHSDPIEFHDLPQLFHELRTPVNQIIGYSELLQEQAHDSGKEALVADLKKIHNAAQLWLTQAEAYLVPDSAVRAQTASAPAMPRLRSLVELPFAPKVNPPVGGSGEPGKFLIVDDDESTRELLARRLRTQRHTVTTAETGRQALKLLAKEPFDLVLLDVIMPLIGGLEVLQQIKADPKLWHTPVIMISALDEMSEVVRCIEMGAEDYLPKPFDPVLLRARIGAALEKKRLRDRERMHLEQLEAAQKQSERLLLNVLPQPIADRLKKGEETIADTFKDVTVLFADLVGFTSYSLQVSAVELVDVLNEIFTSFDNLVAELGMEKIKTIGDAYMAVAGVPVPRANHAEAAADLALGMRKVTEAFNARYHASIQIRIGIHTGPVVAGVIGAHKFAYDLWGNTVNTASRMESHSLPGKIQVSSTTYERLRDKYELALRGEINVKGLGPTQTWFLEAKRS